MQCNDKIVVSLQQNHKFAKQYLFHYKQRTANCTHKYICRWSYCCIFQRNRERESQRKAPMQCSSERSTSGGMRCNSFDEDTGQGCSQKNMVQTKTCNGKYKFKREIYSNHWPAMRVLLHRRFGTFQCISYCLSKNALFRCALKK